MDSKNKNRQQKKFGKSSHKTILAVNGYFQLYPYCGQGRYLREFLKWAKQNPSIDLHVCYPAKTKNKIYQFFFEQLFFPLFCWLIKAEKMFIPYFAPPIWLPAPATITVHDLIHFRLPGLKWSTGLYKKLLLLNLRGADKIITDSAWSKSDIFKKTAINPQKITVIPLGVDPQVFFPKKIVRENFFLWIGNDSPHKQKDLIFSLYKKHKIPTPIVMVGLKNDPKIPGVSLMNNLSDQELSLLYSKAKALIVTSSFEGFGLPVIEAINCHCPVIAKNIPSIKGIPNTQISFFDSSAELLRLLKRPLKQMPLTKPVVKLTWANTFAVSFAIIDK